jgi:hypothetical protein
MDVIDRRNDRLARTQRLAASTIDALRLVDDEHVDTLVEAIDGAYRDALGVFAFDASFSDGVSHS